MCLFSPQKLPNVSLDNVLFLRMKPVLLCVALLLAGPAAGEDEERKGAGVKGACKRTGPKPSDKLFAPYTIPIKNKSKQYFLYNCFLTRSV